LFLLCLERRRSICEATYNENEKSYVVCVYTGFNQAWKETVDFHSYFVSI
jgi:hypothetical protein